MNREPPNLSVSCQNRWQHYQASHSSIIQPSSGRGTARECVFVRVCPQRPFRWGDTEEIGCQTALRAERDHGSAISFQSPHREQQLRNVHVSERCSCISAGHQKENIQRVQQNAKESVLVERIMRWWMPCVNCDCSEHWGYWTRHSVGDACHNSSSSLSALSLHPSEALEERKCRCVVSVFNSSSLRLSLSLLSEYGAPRAKTLKPSALLSLPLLSTFA